MSGKLISRSVVVALALFLITGLLLADSNAQKPKRKRRSSTPQITNPDIYQPPANDNSNSNSSGNAATTGDNTNSPRTQAEKDADSMKKTIETLSNQVDKLNNKLNQMEDSQRSMVDLERLSRAEQRSAQLRSEQRDVQGKIGDLEVRLEDVEFALKPENIERSTMVYGTTRPEEVRAQRKRQLETERDRLKIQLEQLHASDQRLQEAVATSDAEIDRLQKRLDAADQSAIENSKTKVQSGDYSLPNPSPTPTP